MIQVICFKHVGSIRRTESCFMVEAFIDFTFRFRCKNGCVSGLANIFCGVNKKNMWSDLVAIFGGTGAVLIGMAGCLWKVFRSYQISYVVGEPIDNLPVETLNNTWEHPGTIPFENHFKRMVYATSTPTKQWKIQMQPGDGSVFVYTDMHEAPPNKQRFLRIRLKGVSADAKMSFVQKYWTGTSQEYIESAYHPPKPTPISPKDGVHMYLQPSLIGVDDVTKEQLGIYFDATEVGYDCVIEEAYMKAPTRICHVGWLTILYYPKS